MTRRSLAKGSGGLGGPTRNAATDYANWGAMTQSAVLASRLTRVLLGCAIAGLVGGCGMSSLTSGLGGGMFGGSSSKPASVSDLTEEQMLSAAKADASSNAALTTGGIAYGCPRVQVWPRDNNVTIYETGRVGDGLAIMHRGEITKTARECQIEPGRVTVKYGFSGRVLLGPRGKSGNVTLPVNVFVTDAKREKIASDALKVSVDVALEDPIGYFSAVRTVTFAIPEGSRPGEYEVFVAFDRTLPGAG